MKHNYKIYQLEIHDFVKKAYASWDWLNKYFGGFNMDGYKEVWEDEIETPDETQAESVLEVLFEKFNFAHPKNYHGRSMSTSDVVLLDGVKYYCNSFGWVKID